MPKYIARRPKIGKPGWTYKYQRPSERLVGYSARITTGTVTSRGRIRSVGGYAKIAKGTRLVTGRAVTLERTVNVNKVHFLRPPERNAFTASFTTHAWPGTDSKFIVRAKDFSRVTPASKLRVMRLVGMR
jgi:hypothetical protein